VRLVGFGGEQQVKRSVLLGWGSGGPGPRRGHRHCQSEFFAELQVGGESLPGAAAQRTASSGGLIKRPPHAQPVVKSFTALTGVVASPGCWRSPALFSQPWRRW